ncbi:MAG TPA: hypothetical protein VMI54_23510 [Polyangiaceae bacterium]|nr:hypothetical protein [Polyangiaceae bacterium]
MRSVVAVTLVAFAAGCGGGQVSNLGASEQFRVRGAQFFPGPLPGSEPTSDPYVVGAPPQVRISTANYVMQRGYGGNKLGGTVTGNAWSAGIELQGVGTGWWMLGAGDIDSTTNPPGFTLSGVADFAPDLAVGPTFLVGVALTRDGKAGPQYEQAICIGSDGPDGSAPCGGITPPVAAITLTWDTEADMDLQVLTPDGTLVSPKHPNVHPPPKTGSPDPNLPHINRDSNAGCVIDGWRSESLIWPSVPSDQGQTEYPSGDYLIYANLFDPCGQQAVHFHVIVTTAAAPSDDGAGGAGGDDTLVERTMLDKSGEVIAIQANPTSNVGLYVSDYEFQ